MTEEPSYASLIEEEDTLNAEWAQYRAQHERKMADLNRRILAAMRREGIS